MIERLSRIVLVTGKGGVGKTTVAAGIARAAVLGGRPATLIEFGDGASGKRALGPKSQVQHRVITSQDAIQAAADDLFGSAIVARAVTANFAVKRLLRAAPALRELALLEYVRRVAEDHARHTVVVDMPASGHGLSWLRIPQHLRELLVTGPMHKMAARVHDEVTAPGRSSVVIVTLPELLVLEETVELARALTTEMRLPAPHVVVNRVPEPVTDAALRESHALIEAGTEADRPDREALHRFLSARHVARDAADAVLTRVGQGGHLPSMLIPLAPVDPTVDAVATWLTGAAPPAPGRKP